MKANAELTIPIDNAESIKLLLSRLKQITSQIRKESMVVDQKYLLMDLDLLDKRIINFFLFSDALDLEESHQALNSILLILHKISSIELNASLQKELKFCLDKIIAFNNKNESALISQKELSSINNKGLFLSVPDDILFFILLQLNSKDFVQFTSSCCLLFEARMSIMKNEKLILHYLSSLPMENYLEFIQANFRPSSGKLYQHLEEMALRDDVRFEAYLCYALITVDINKLERNKIEKLHEWITHSKENEYKKFSESIQMIQAILSHNHDQKILSPKYTKFYNLSGAIIPCRFFYDKRYVSSEENFYYSNLENTKWSVDRRGVLINYLDHKAYFEFKIQFLFSNCNFKNARFVNGTYEFLFRNCNLENASFQDIKSDLFVLINTNTKNLQLLSPYHLTSIDSLKKGLSRWKIVATKDNEISGILARNICDHIQASSLPYDKQKEIMEYAINHKIFNQYSNIESTSSGLFSKKKIESKSHEILQAAFDKLISTPFIPHKPELFETLSDHTLHYIFNNLSPKYQAAVSQTNRKLNTVINNSEQGFINIKLLHAVRYFNNNVFDSYNAKMLDVEFPEWPLGSYSAIKNNDIEINETFSEIENFLFAKANPGYLPFLHEAVFLYYLYRDLEASNSKSHHYHDNRQPDHQLKLINLLITYRAKLTPYENPDSENNLFTMSNLAKLWGELKYPRHYTPKQMVGMTPVIYAKNFRYYKTVINFEPMPSIKSKSEDDGIFRLYSGSDEVATKTWLRDCSEENKYEINININILSYSKYLEAILNILSEAVKNETINVFRVINTNQLTTCEMLLNTSLSELQTTSYKTNFNTNFQLFNNPINIKFPLELKESLASVLLVIEDLLKDCKIEDNTLTPADISLPSMPHISMRQDKKRNGYKQVNLSEGLFSLSRKNCESSREYQNLTSHIHEIKNELASSQMRY